MGAGGSNRAQREAQAEEKRRQEAISATTGRINSMFDDPAREAQRQQFGSDMLSFYMDDANRQKGSADRDLRFSLARSGLTGGSGAIDANRTLGEEYQRGVLEAQRRSQGAVADLRGQDEQARLSLTGLAQSGLDVGAAATQAASAMRASLEGANATARVQGMGDIFGSVATAKKRSEEWDSKRRADDLYTRYYGPFYSSMGGN